MKILFFMTLLAFSSCFSFKEGFDFVKEKLTQGKQAVNAFLTWKNEKVDFCAVFCTEIKNLQNVGECRTNCYAFEEHFLQPGEQLPLEAMLNDKQLYITTFACYQEALGKSEGEPEELNEIFFACLQDE